MSIICKLEKKNETYRVSRGTEVAFELFPIVMCNSPDCIQANWFCDAIGISVLNRKMPILWVNYEFWLNFQLKNLPPTEGFGNSLVGVLCVCEPWPFTFDRSDLPKNPSLISISVGYGRLKSPCCHVNGALIAFEALILWKNLHFNLCFY